jgi:hypothetical protein
MRGHHGEIGHHVVLAEEGAEGLHEFAQLVGSGGEGAPDPR